jgi:hypothetical protein
MTEPTRHPQNRSDRSPKFCFGACDTWGSAFRQLLLSASASRGLSQTLGIAEEPVFGAADPWLRLRQH